MAESITLLNVTLEMKAAEQNIPVTLFFMFFKFKVVLTVHSMDETLKCVHLNWELLGSMFLWYCLSYCIGRFF